MDSPHNDKIVGLNFEVKQYSDMNNTLNESYSEQGRFKITLKEPQSTKKLTKSEESMEKAKIGESHQKVNF